MSIQTQWYYVKDNERCGPVDPAQLKQLADSGELQRTNLVWRAGMADWVEAEQVNGLFPETKPAATPIPAPTAKVTSTSQATQAPATAATTSPAAEPAKPTAPTETPAPAPQSEPRHPIATVQHSGDTHPIALLLNWLHAKPTGSFVNASNRLFTRIGFWGILFYMMLITTGSLVAAFQTKMYWQLGVAIGVSILAFALQYPAIKMLKLLDQWKFESPVPRPIFDTVALLASLSGVGILVGLTLYALKLGVYSPIFAILAAFIVLTHLATVALSLSNQNDSQEETTASEATGLFGGLLAVLLRTVPVVFGVGISLSCLELLYSMISLRNANDSVIFTATAMYTAYWILYCLLLPAAAYVVLVTLRAVGRFILLRI